MNNEQKTGITELWSTTSHPFQNDAETPWLYPTFTRINNQEKS